MRRFAILDLRFAIGRRSAGAERPPYCGLFYKDAASGVVPHKRPELFEQELTEGTEAKALFSLFPPVKETGRPAGPFRKYAAPSGAFRPESERTFPGGKNYERL